MMRVLRLLAVLLAIMMVLAACNGDEETADATPTGAPAEVVLPTAEIVAVATDVPPLPTSTPLPTPTMEPTATSTVVPTPGAGEAVGASGAAQDPATAATAAAAAGGASALMAPWQSIIGVAVLNQTICTTLQALAQTGQQGGLGALATAAQLLAAGPILQGAQQQLTGLAGVPGAEGLLTSLRADQAAMLGLLGQWSGGQVDAATAAASLQVICGATDATAAQAQQGAQDAGIPEEDVNGMFDQSKQDAAGSVGGLRP